MESVWHHAWHVLCPREEGSGLSSLVEIPCLPCLVRLFASIWLTPSSAYTQTLARGWDSAYPALWCGAGGFLLNWGHFSSVLVQLFEILLCPKHLPCLGLDRTFPCPLPPAPHRFHAALCITHIQQSVAMPVCQPSKTLSLHNFGGTSGDTCTFILHTREAG